MQNEQENRLKNKKVLIIEDEKPLAKAMEIKLLKEGLEAKAVFGGAEGIKELETGKYSLVLLDLMMPIIDGWGVLEAVRKKGIKVKTVVTSNLGQEEDKKKALELGAEDFLVKSDLTLAAIAQKVKDYLGLVQ